MKNIGLAKAQPSKRSTSKYDFENRCLGVNCINIAIGYEEHRACEGAAFEEMILKIVA